MTNFEKVGIFMKTFGQEVKTKAEFPSDKIEIYDHIMESRKLTFMADLFGVMAHSPGALQSVASVGEHVRFNSGLDEVLREMVICTVSQEVGNFYEWCHHFHLHLKFY